MLVLVLAALPMQGVLAAGQTTTAGKPSSAEAKATDVQLVAMNRLVKASLEQSLKLMAKEKKPIYPFALLQYKNGRVDSMTYRPVKDKNGKVKPQPDAKQWAAELFVRLRQLAKTQPNLEIALLTRMDTVKDKQGKDVLGIWTE